MYSLWNEYLRWDVFERKHMPSRERRTSKKAYKINKVIPIYNLFLLLIFRQIDYIISRGEIDIENINDVSQNQLDDLALAKLKSDGYGITDTKMLKEIRTEIGITLTMSGKLLGMKFTNDQINKFVQKEFPKDEIFRKINNEAEQIYGIELRKMKKTKIREIRKKYISLRREKIQARTIVIVNKLLSVGAYAFPEALNPDVPSTSTCIPETLITDNNKNNENDTPDDKSDSDDDIAPYYGYKLKNNIAVKYRKKKGRQKNDNQ